MYTSDITTDAASPTQLQESIRLREQRLAANIDELVGRLQPKALQARAQEKVTSAFVQPDGSPRVGRVAVLGVAVLGVATLITVSIVRAARR